MKNILHLYECIDGDIGYYGVGFPTKAQRKPGPPVRQRRNRAAEGCYEATQKHATHQLRDELEDQRMKPPGFQVSPILGPICPSWGKYPWDGFEWKIRESNG